MNNQNRAIKRIKADVREMMTDPSDQYSASPCEDNMFDWHFTIRGPVGTEFEHGIYHGRILLHSDYPFKPPNIILLTPNGRFELKKKICLSISAYHPEHWQPAWGVRLILEALISFLPSKGEGAIGALDYSPEERKKLAKKSLDWVCPLCGNIRDLIPPLDESKTIANKASDGKSKYADQIAQLHIHGLEKEKEEPDDKKEDKDTGDSKTNELADQDSVAPSPMSAETTVIPENRSNLNTQTDVIVNSTTSGIFVVDSFLYYAAVAIFVAIAALLYKKLLLAFGVVSDI